LTILSSNGIFVIEELVEQLRRPPTPSNLRIEAHARCHAWLKAVRQPENRKSAAAGHYMMELSPSKVFCIEVFLNKLLAGKNPCRKIHSSI